MVLQEDDATKTIEASGKDVKIFRDSEGRAVIAVVLMDEDGDNLLSLVQDGESASDAKGIFIFGQDDDGNIAPVRINADSEGLITIDVGHSKVHQGNSYLSWINDEDLDNNETLVLSFKTDATKEMHMTLLTNGTVEGNSEVREGVTWDTGTGTPNPIYNRNRNSSNTSMALEDTDGSFNATMNLVLNPDNVTGGTVIDRHHFGVGKKAGGEAREREEIELKKDTNYCFVITSEGNDNDVLLKLSWYEIEE